MDTLDKYYAAYLPQMAVAVFLPLALLAFIFPADWVSGVILVLGAPLIPIFMILVGKGTEQLNEVQWRKLALMSAHFFDVIEGLTTLKLFGASRNEAEIIGRISAEYRESTMSVLRVAFLSSLVLEFFTTLGVAMIAVFIGFRFYYARCISCRASSCCCWRRNSFDRCAPWARSIMHEWRRSPPRSGSWS